MILLLSLLWFIVSFPTRSFLLQASSDASLAVPEGRSSSSGERLHSSDSLAGDRHHSSDSLTGDRHHSSDNLAGDKHCSSDRLAGDKHYSSAG